MADEDLRRVIEESGEKTRRHFDAVAENLDRKIDTIAEAVTSLDEKMDRRFDEEVRSGFAETQAMIRFSYAELDRRLRTVENDLETLQQRVDRLES